MSNKKEEILNDSLNLSENAPLIPLFHYSKTLMIYLLLVPYTITVGLVFVLLIHLIGRHLFHLDNQSIFLTTILYH